jgi:hypothetical protein
MDALETVLVGLIVAAAALFSIWRLMPTRHRLRLIQGLAKRTSQGQGGQWLARLERAARVDLAHSSCGQCSANVPSTLPASRTRRQNGSVRHRRPAAPLR